MRNVAMFMLGAAVLVGAVGCPGVIGPPASAILAGDWTGTDADGLVVVVTFNDDGIVVSIAREDGVSAEVTNSTTELDGDAVTITIGGRTFEGTLSEDQNTITGTIEQEITAGDGDIEITIPAGDFEIDRVDLCTDNTCDDGDACNGVETCDADTGDCVDGTPVSCDFPTFCFEPDGACVDPCDDADCSDDNDCTTDTCTTNEDGTTTCTNDTACDDADSCTEDDACGEDGVCAGTAVECLEGDICVDGDCVVDPCEGIICADCEECVEGVCEPLVGDAEFGATYYSSPEAGCSDCHGPDGEGPPSLIGAECSLIFPKLTDETIFHVGGKRDITGQDAADLEAWLAM